MKKIAIVDDSRAYIELITDVLTKESGCTEDHPFRKPLLCCMNWKMGMIMIFIF